MAQRAGEPGSLPSGLDSCAHLLGPPLVEVEVERLRVDEPGTLIEQLLEHDWSRWKNHGADGDNRAVRSAGTAEGLRYSVKRTQRAVSSANEVRRTEAGERRSRGHGSGTRRLDRAIRHYLLSAERGVGRLRETVEVPSTSRVFRFLQRRLVANANHATNEPLDGVLQDVGPPAAGGPAGASEGIAS